MNPPPNPADDDDAWDALRGRRTNMLNRRPERWRPPLMGAAAGRRGRLLGAVRRWLDLQAGTVWRDLALVLPSLRGVVVDVGCGGQPYRPLLGPGARYLGIDTAAAEAHFGYRMPDTVYFTGDVWPVGDGAADAVLCTETLEHVLDPRQFLAEAARCLRGGGRLVLTVPFAARWHFIPHDYWRYTPSGLDHLLSAAGFTDVAVYARGNAVTVACYKVMALILPLLLPAVPSRAAAWALRAIGLLLSPALACAALIANLSLLGAGGDDCLGYTVLAVRSAAAAEISAAAGQ